MVTSLPISSTVQEQKTDSSIQENIQVYRLAMQWTLDKNAKLICQWVQIKN